MSTRASISLVGPLHLFEEVLSEEICVDIACSAEEKLNEKYGSPIITLEQLKELYDDLGEFLKNRGLL